MTITDMNMNRTVAPTTAKNRVSLSETTWRAQLGNTPEQTEAKMNELYPDALVMTARGVRVELEMLVGESVSSFNLPVIEILGERTLD